MSGRKRYLIGAMVVLLLLGIVIVMAIARAGARTRFVTLVDGRVVEFLGTSFGNTSFTTDTKWTRVARRVLPVFASRWIPTPIVTGNLADASNSLSVHVKFNNSPMAFARANGSQFNIAAEDSGGFRYHWGCTEAFFPTASGIVSSITVRAFPRRQRDFMVHLLNSRTGADLGGFRVPNPAFHEYPVWRPSPLPITLTNGPVALTLTGLVRRVSRNIRFADPEWGVKTGDPAWANAKIHGPVIQDATGNEGPILSPAEAAWRLRATVWRRPPVEFSAAETFVLTNLVLPANGNQVPINQSAERAGVRIDALYLGKTYGQLLFIVARVKNLQPDDELQFRAGDGIGGWTNAEPSDYVTQPDGSRIYRSVLNSPGGIKSISVEIIINRPLVFDFLVSPEAVRATDP